MATRIARKSFLTGLALACLYAPAAHAQECPADSQLDYVCGTQRPEDLLTIPDTPWMVTSGFSAGAGLKLVDTRSRSQRLWFTGVPGQLQPDRQRFPRCPGPPDPALLNLRGLGLRDLGREEGEGRWLLLAVNHGGRESIEAFIVSTADMGEPQLQWIGCQLMPPGQVGNSVASFADGTVLATVLTRPGTSIGDFMLGRVTGAVWQWRMGDTADFTMVPGSELPGNNGLEVDPDERHFYVVSFGLHAVAIFDRQAPADPPELVVAPDFMPDNIHWTGGRLLLTGMRLDEPACGGLRRVVDGVADPMLCHRGWVVGELDLAARRISTFAYGHPQPGFNGHSAAALVEGELWLGSFQTDRLAIVRNFTAPQPLPPAPSIR
jgi:hypothetical protein